MEERGEKNKTIEKNMQDDSEIYKNASKKFKERTKRQENMRSIITEIWR